MSVLPRSNGLTPSARRGYGGNSVQSVVMDDTMLDAFHRIRVGQPFGLMDAKMTYGLDSAYQTLTNGAGSAVSHVPAESSAELSIGTADGAYVIRESFKPYGYTPGKAVTVMMTGVMEPAKNNLVQRIGYFDDDNGLFFELNGSTVNVVVRTNTSGVPVDTQYSQDQWNLDVLDTNVPAKNISGINLDITKAEIFFIDFQWLGVGRVRFGFVIDGVPIFVHEVNHANILDKVYMSTPDLPTRYEIRNDGATASASTLKQICSSVVSEAGYRLPGYQHAKGNGATLRAVTTRIPIFAIRQEATHNSLTNKRFAELVAAKGISSGGSCFFEVAQYRDVSAVTANWTAMTEGDSSIEYSVDISSITGTEHVVDAFYTTAAPGVSSPGASQTSDNIVDRHNFISRTIDNNSLYFVVFATSLGGSIDAGAILTWVEFD